MMSKKARRRAMVAGGVAAAAKHRANKSGQAEAADQQQRPVPRDAPTDTPAAPAGSNDMVTELENLKKLLDEGVLTQAEFDTEKQKILSGS